MEWFDRTIRLIGKDAFNLLQNSKVAILGVGGVGSNAAIALCRAGVGEFLLIDKDVVDVTNINRQTIARTDTVGMDKVTVMQDDMLKINPNVRIDTKKVFLSQDNIASYIDCSIDYVLDCIDNITCKVFLAKMCYNNNIPLISCMGAGNRVLGSFEVADIFETEIDPVARIMRKRLKEENVPSLKVVWTKEPPISLDDGDRAPASMSFTPALAGITMAQYVCGELIKNAKNGGV